MFMVTHFRHLFAQQDLLSRNLEIGSRYVIDLPEENRKWRRGKQYLAVVRVIK